MKKVLLFISHVVVAATFLIVGANIEVICQLLFGTELQVADVDGVGHEDLSNLLPLPDFVATGISDDPDDLYYYHRYTMNSQEIVLLIRANPESDEIIDVFGLYCEPGYGRLRIINSDAAEVCRLFGVAE